MWQNTIAATDSAETTSDLISLNVTNGKIHESYISENNVNNDSMSFSSHTNQSSNEIACQASSYLCDFGIVDFRKRKLETNEIGSGDNRTKRGRGRGSRGSYKPRGRTRVVGSTSISNPYGMQQNQVPRVCVNPEILKILGKTNSNTNESYNAYMSSQNQNSDYFYYDSNSSSAHNHQMEIQQTVYDYNNSPTNYMSFAHSQHSAFRPLDYEYSSQNFHYDPEYQMQISDITYGNSNNNNNNNEDDRVYQYYNQNNMYNIISDIGHISNSYYYHNNASAAATYTYGNTISSDQRSFLDISNPHVHHLINDTNQQENYNQLSSEFECNSHNNNYEESPYIDEVNNYFSNYNNEDSMNYYLNSNSVAVNNSNCLPPVSTVLFEKNCEIESQSKQNDFIIDNLNAEVNKAQSEQETNIQKPIISSDQQNESSNENAPEISTA